MPTAHPTEAALLEYASGHIGDGMGLLVASHLTLCPPCRRATEANEVVGGALLAVETPSSELPDLASVLARIENDANEQLPPVSDDADSPLPRPLRRAVGMNYSDIPWRARLPGLSEHVISEANGDDGREIKVGLVKAKPGLKIPAHTHEGDEATLILCGAMEDDGKVYRKGDVALSGDHDDHRPKILDEGICVCLTVLNGGLRFTGPFGRALNLFT